MEADPSEEFDHYLCLKLGWRSIAELRHGMSSREYQRWCVYFARRAQERELAMEQAKG